MSCPSASCPVSTKVYNSTICNASNYTALKRNRILYQQYTHFNPYVVCGINPTARYPSYELRKQTLYGCLFNKRICLKQCLGKNASATP